MIILNITMGTMLLLLGEGYAINKKIVSGTYIEPVQEGKKFSKVWYKDRECMNEFKLKEWNGESITIYAALDNENEFHYRGTLECNGSNYIDTGISLFSSENAHRNFKILFEVETNQNIVNKFDTIMNTMYENSQHNWPGITYRIFDNKKNEFQICGR